MKILHFADLHLGHETYGQIDPKTGFNTRLLDFLNSFDQIVDYALKEKIDLVVFAGDAYKTRDPNPTYQREFGKRIKKIASKIPVVLITGNHDISPSLGKADTLEIFPTLEVPNVYVFSRPAVKEIPITHHPLPITVITLPWLSKSYLLKEEERKKSTEELKTLLSSKISQIFKDLLKKIDPQKPTIAIVHQSVSGATFSSNQGVYVGTDPLISLSTLANPKLAYIALGHIHKHQVLNENPPVIYSGSIERIDFGEEKEKKGFIEVRIDEGKSKKTSWRFIPLEARKFLTISIQIPENKDPNQYLLKEIRKNKIAGAIVRLQIQGKENALSRLYEPDIKEVLKDAYFVASISKESERKKASKIEIRPKELSPLGWLSEYLKLKNIKKDEAKILKEEALKLMEEM